MNRLIPAAAGVMALAVGATALAAGPSDFMKKAIQGDNSEIMLGQLAQKKAMNAGVKDFGQTLVADHTQAKQDAVKLAATVGVTPPSTPMPEAKAEYKKLQGMSGAAFDKEFVGYMVTDHKKDIADFTKEANSGSGAVPDMARKTLPTLKKHLAMAQKLQDQV